MAVGPNSVTCMSVLNDEIRTKRTAHLLSHWDCMLGKHLSSRLDNTPGDVLGNGLCLHMRSYPLKTFFMYICMPQFACHNWKSPACKR